MVASWTFINAHKSSLTINALDFYIFLLRVVKYIISYKLKKQTKKLSKNKIDGISIKR